MSPEERERERSRDIPYEFSLSALSSYFFETGIRQGWLPGDGEPSAFEKPLLLAVSGGSDSTALLWLFHIFLGSNLVVVHFEHGIRGSESKEDAFFVEKMAKQWGIEAVVEHGDVPGSLQRGESLETGARRLRYSFFERVAKEREAYGVALGHNKDDAAETALFNLLRGSGVRGVAGMQERRGIFFRPLLMCSRKFLRDVLRYRGITWCEDRTNEDDSYTRNFIRNKLIPSIESNINAGVIDHLVAFAEEMRYYREEEERLGDILIGATMITEPECGRDLDRALVSVLSLREKIILVREIGRRFDIPVLSRERCIELAHLMEGKRRFEFQCGRGAYILGDRNRIKWRKIGGVC